MSNDSLSKLTKNDRYDVPKLYLTIAAVIFSIVAGSSIYVFANNPRSPFVTERSVGALKTKKEQLAQSLANANLTSDAIVADLESLEDEVKELTRATGECTTDLKTCEATLETYQNPPVTCGDGTVKKDWYCRSMGINDVDFEARGAGVGAGILMIMLWSMKK